MPDTVNTAEMNNLAQKLIKMKFDRAKGYLRGLDRGCILEMYRDAVGTDQWLTRYALPNKNLLVTLVEQKEIAGPATDLGYVPMRCKFVEARVEELPPNHLKDNRGNTTQATTQGMVKPR